MPVTRSARWAFAFLFTVRPLAAQDSVPPPPIAIARANMDTTCAPCADFFRYANGAWLDKTAIPPQFASYGIGRQMVDRTDAQLHIILEDARRQQGTTDATTRRVGTFYGSCMDTARIERAGAQPLQAALRRIAELRDRHSLMGELGALQHDGVDAGVPVVVFASLHSSAVTALYLAQGGIGLPDRDFYLRDDTTLARIRAAYQTHLARLLALGTGTSRPDDGAAAQVMAIETALARAAQPAQDARVPANIDHPMTRQAIQRLGPTLDWSAFYHALGATPPETVTVVTPAEVTMLDSLARATPLEAWHAYLEARLLETGAPALSAAFQREGLALRTLVSGETELRPRWQRCAVATDNAIGEALGQLYVAQEFTPAAKQRALALVANLRTAMADRIRGLTWMSDSTKRAALVKLAAVTTKIGYPDRWRDYGALELRPDAYVLNLFRANRFELDRQLAKVGKPVDRGEWGMTPPTLDAYSNPLNVEIVFPAGILQPPLFDPAADDAVNYGAIGAVIGHELTHEFDDQGRQFDARGNLTNWWAPADSAAFVQRADVVVREYNGFLAVDTLHINGQLTLGENIADIGGLIIAHDAWRRSLAGKPEPPAIDGFTPEQRFFLSFASSWRSTSRPEVLRTRVLSDPHSPPVWRVNGVVPHLAPFYAAFGCHAGDAMYRPPEARMQIW